MQGEDKGSDGQPQLWMVILSVGILVAIVVMLSHLDKPVIPRLLGIFGG